MFFNERKESLIITFRLIYINRGIFKTKIKSINKKRIKKSAVNITLLIKNSFIKITGKIVPELKLTGVIIAGREIRNTRRFFFIKLFLFLIM